MTNMYSEACYIQYCACVKSLMIGCMLIYVYVCEYVVEWTCYVMLYLLGNSEGSGCSRSEWWIVMVVHLGKYQKRVL